MPWRHYSSATTVGFVSDVAKRATYHQFFSAASSTSLMGAYVAPITSSSSCGGAQSHGIQPVASPSSSWQQNLEQGEEQRGPGGRMSFWLLLSHLETHEGGAPGVASLQGDVGDRVALNEPFTAHGDDVSGIGR